MKNVIILGGSYAGVSTAHRILKQAAKSANRIIPFKITLVSPNTDLYWNMASPRAILPGQLTDDQLFQPIAAGFKKYSPDQFESILGYATSIDVNKQTVTISVTGGLSDAGADALEPRILDYDHLILATGSRTRNDTPLKGLGSTDKTKAALHHLQGRIEEAKVIVVAGGGVTGVEVAGELGFQYGRTKEIILIVSGASILEESPASVSNLATTALQALNVKVRFQTRVTSTFSPSTDDIDKLGLPLTLPLSDNTTIHADMYIPSFGLIPNSGYIPAQYLNPDGYVLIDEFMNVKANGEAALPNVWALGDVADLEYAQFVSCDKQSVHLAKNMLRTLKDGGGKKVELVPYKATTKRFMGLQIGRKAGTGHFGTIRIPSFVIVWARKNLFVDSLRPTVDGSLF